MKTNSPIVGSKIGSVSLSYAVNATATFKWFVAPKVLVWSKKLSTYISITSVSSLVIKTSIFWYKYPLIMKRSNIVDTKPAHVFNLVMP